MKDEFGRTMVMARGEKRLVDEDKNGWKWGKLPANTIFLTGVASPPADVQKRDGFDPVHAVEDCSFEIDEVKNTTKLLFAVPIIPGQRPSGRIASRFGGFLYAIELPTGSRVACQDGKLARTREVGIPVAVKWNQVVGIWHLDDSGKKWKRYYFSPDDFIKKAQEKSQFQALPFSPNMMSNRNKHEPHPSLPSVITLDNDDS